jgi:hypothetical protein
MGKLQEVGKLVMKICTIMLYSRHYWDLRVKKDDTGGEWKKRKCL